MAEEPVPVGATVGIDAGGALLLRPDGVIAGRATAPHPDARAELDTVLRRALFRG